MKLDNDFSSVVLHHMLDCDSCPSRICLCATNCQRIASLICRVMDGVSKRPTAMSREASPEPAPEITIVGKLAMIDEARAALSRAGTLGTRSHHHLLLPCIRACRLATRGLAPSPPLIHRGPLKSNLIGIRASHRCLRVRVALQYLRRSPSQLDHSWKGCLPRPLGQAIGSFLDRSWSIL